MLSSLSRGYGSWTGDVETHLPVTQDANLPNVDQTHKHGITVSPRSKGPSVIIPVAEDGQLNIPKTFATRKGALMLFTAPDNMPKEPAKSSRLTPRRKRQRQRDVVDLSLKLRTLERLSLSVLQFGDKLYDKDTSSISDKENKLMLNFLHDLNQEQDDMDLHSQPGGDYKFYLRDLKRRASHRGHGVGDTTPHRARSAELQEILDDLEQTWPKYSSNQSFRRDSTLTGSMISGDNFFHPESPAPSTVSIRSNARGRVLSCKKLTASLKSLTSLGRPTSTEPDTRSIVSDSFVASTQYCYGESRRSKTSMWMSEASSPAFFTQSRPQTSHRSKSALGQNVPEHKLVTSPEPSEYEGGTKVQNMWVEMENHGDLSYSDDGHSLVSAVDSEFRVSDRGHAMTPVKEERMSTPTRGDRDAMLAEAASVLSSLVEEEDIELPAAFTDTTLDETNTSQWPGLTETEEQGFIDGRRSGSRSKTPKLKSESGENVDIDSLAQPLQPPYSGPMTRENRSTSPMDLSKEESYRATQEGNTPYLQSRAASVEPGAEEIVYQGERGESIYSSNTTPVPRSDTPAGLSGHAEGMIQEVSQMLSDADHIRTSSALGSASMSSTDKQGQDPDTLVSMLGRQDASELSDKLPQSLANQILKSSSPIPPAPSTSADATITLIPPSPMATPSSSELQAATADQPVPLPVTDDTEEEEEPQQKPLTPKRRERKEEAKSPKSEEEGEEKEVEGEEGGEVEESEVKESNEEGETELSERVKQEIEEREQRQIKLQEEKAAKEAEEARKKSEEEMAKQAVEDKRKAAEERLRQKAEELAKKKEEEKLLLEQAPAVPVEETQKAAKGKKGKVKGSKSETGDKKYVNALDITSVQPDGAEKEDALSKLKAGNKDVDLPVDKIQEFMNTQGPKVKFEPEKKEVHVPEHLKEMFNRRTESQAQEELEKGIAKMRNAMNDALGGSILQEESVEGLSAEEFAAAQEALKEKLKQAEEQMLEAVTPEAALKKSATAKVRKQPKKASPTRKKKGAVDQANKTDEVKEKEAKKEQQRLEKQKRLEEVKELQKKIAMKEDERKTKEREAKRKAEELAEDMEAIRREEEELERAEQDARDQLAALRKVQREEREARRKADLEKKKQEAIDKREKEKVMIEQARQKEQEMLDRIADGEMARRLREEEEAKREEEEQLAQERYEAEMKEAQRLAEEEEERLRELERQAEEEAFQRLMDEKEEAEERRLQLEREAARMREEEEKQRAAMLEEEKRLEGERKKHEEEEEARREQERERLRELQRLEEEAREKMRAELEKRRLWAMKRREWNLEQRANLDAIRQCQGVTDPWTFSYFIRWPKESYHRPMGHDPKKKAGGLRPKPKPSTQQGGSNSQSAVDVAAIP